VKEPVCVSNILAIILGVAAASAFASSSARAAEPEKVDCHGGKVTISGEHRFIEIANCAEIRVEGSHNNISGRLPKRSKVFVTGDGNVLTLNPVNGISFSRVKDTGHDNMFHAPG
jgi:hypothetical protein